MAHHGPKVNPGDKVRLKAPFINRMLDLANHEDGFPQQGITGNARGNIVQVKNISDAYVETSGILAIGSSILKPDEDELVFRSQRPVFEAEKPVEGLHENRLCILLEGLDTGDIGPAMAYGEVAVQVEILDTQHQFATIMDDSAFDSRETLQSAPVGPFFMQWIATGEDSDGLGFAWAMCLFGMNKEELLWRTTSAPSGGEVNVGWSDIDGETGDFELTVKVPTE